MEVTIDGERTKLPDDDDLLMGELELVAKHLGFDVATSLPSQKLIGLVFIALHRKNPDGAIVDQIDAVRKMKVAGLGIEEESAVPLDVAANGHSDKTLVPSGPPA